MFAAALIIASTFLAIQCTALAFELASQGAWKLADGRKVIIEISIYGFVLVLAARCWAKLAWADKTIPHIAWWTGLSFMAFGAWRFFLYLGSINFPEHQRKLDIGERFFLAGNFIFLSATWALHRKKITVTA